MLYLSLTWIGLSMQGHRGMWLIQSHHTYHLPQLPVTCKVTHVCRFNQSFSPAWNWLYLIGSLSHFFFFRHNISTTHLKYLYLTRSRDCAISTRGRWPTSSRNCCTWRLTWNIPKVTWPHRWQTWQISCAARRCRRGNSSRHFSKSSGEIRQVG